MPITTRSTRWRTPSVRAVITWRSRGTVARAYGELYPDIEITGIEIDPEVTAVGRRWLGLGDNPNLHVVADDGRPFLQLTDDRYDLIVVDAYHQPYIPFYLATKEFFALVRDRLRPGGVVALNVAGVPGDERLSRAIGTTLLAAFPDAWRWRPLRFNELMLGFDRPAANSMDAVSDRDFAVDYLHAAALCSVHLSRLAEEIILWASQPFGFVRLPDAWSTGSSIMPNKRNPDAAELVRGHTARIIGDLVALLVLLKGLPLAYAKDLQDDKQPVFDAHDLLILSLAAMAGMIGDLEFVPERMRAAAAAGHATATELADWLASQGVPFREAHHIAGRAVAAAEGAGKALDELSLAELQAIDPRIGEEVMGQLSVEASVKARRSAGGTAPDRVAEAIAAGRAARRSRT